ncbi:hypothetical protein M0804_000252 [Polistes exclamans]|nr:hypothetical protein M0804_000252 [Polistes exclamans]
MGANCRATESEYRVSEVKVGGAVPLRKTLGVEHGVSACFAVWDQDPKLRLDVHRHKNSRGQGGQQRGPVFLRGPLSCDMLLVRYDSAYGIPAFCFVTEP